MEVKFTAMRRTARTTMTQRSQTSCRYFTFKLGVLLYHLKKKGISMRDERVNEYFFGDAENRQKAINLLQDAISYLRGLDADPPAFQVARLAADYARNCNKNLLVNWYTPKSLGVTSDQMNQFIMAWCDDKYCERNDRLAKRIMKEFLKQELDAPTRGFDSEDDRRSHCDQENQHA
jgi:hypothetical protein